MPMTTLTLPGGRQLDVHDDAPEAEGRPVVVWHHGSPQTGALLAPLVVAARARGVAAGLLRAGRVRRLDGAARAGRRLGGR
jgi:hypothetical protein